MFCSLGVGVEIETTGGGGLVVEVGSLEGLPPVFAGVWLAVEVIEGELHPAEYGEEVVDLLLGGALLIQLQLLRLLSLFLLPNPNAHHPLPLTLLRTIHHWRHSEVRGIVRKKKSNYSLYILFI